MSESSLSQVPGKKERGLLERLSSLLLREPEDREQLLEVLQQAHERNLLDADALSMIEGVMQVSDLAAGDAAAGTASKTVEESSAFNDFLAGEEGDDTIDDVLNACCSPRDLTARLLRGLRVRPELRCVLPSAA